MLTVFKNLYTNLSPDRGRLEYVTFPPNIQHVYISALDNQNTLGKVFIHQTCNQKFQIVIYLNFLKFKWWNFEVRRFSNFNLICFKEFRNESYFMFLNMPNYIKEYLANNRDGYQEAFQMQVDISRNKDDLDQVNSANLLLMLRPLV